MKRHLAAACLSVMSSAAIACLVYTLMLAPSAEAQGHKVSTPFNFEIHQLRSDIAYVRVGDLQCLVVSGQVSCASPR